MNQKSAESAINGAWLTGLVIGVLTLIPTGVAILFSGEIRRSELVAPFVFVVIIFALSYGVRRKNKFCAVLLAAYFVFQVAWMTASWIRSKTTPIGILLYAIVMLLLLHGARGVFAYHRIKQKEALSGQEFVEQQ